MTKIKRAVVTELLDPPFDDLSDYQVGEEIYIIKSYAEGMGGKAFIEGLYTAVSAEGNALGEVGENQIKVIDYKEREKFPPAYINEDWFEDNDNTIECVVIGDLTQLGAFEDEAEKEMELAILNEHLQDIGEETVGSLEDLVMVAYDSEVKVMGETKKVLKNLTLPLDKITYKNNLPHLNEEYEVTPKRDDNG